MRYKERPRPDHPDDILIPESVAIALFNRITGAHCQTMEQTVTYLEEHPEARERLRKEAASFAARASCDANKIEGEK